MKKLVMILFVACLALLLCNSIFAAEGTIVNTVNPADTVHESVNLVASVGPYASITFGTPQTLIFKGSANEEKQGEVSFRVESNCDALVWGYGTAFNQTYEGRPYSISTLYRTVPADNRSTDWTPAGLYDLDAPNVVYPRGISTGVVQYKGILGAISAQPAGTYGAVYTLVVSSPMNVH